MAKVSNTGYDDPIPLIYIVQLTLFVTVRYSLVMSNVLEV